MLIFLTASSLVKSNVEINRKLFAQQCLKPNLSIFLAKLQNTLMIELNIAQRKGEEL